MQSQEEIRRAGIDWWCNRLITTTDVRLSPVYTCANDASTRHIYDLLITTIDRNWPDAAFKIVLPDAQQTLHRNQSYSINWRTKPGTPKHKVHILIHDTSKTDWREGTVLDVKNVPNTGRYEWHIPSTVASAGPYLIEISFVVPEVGEPPALSGGRIYSGVSGPFYIQ